MSAQFRSQPAPTLPETTEGTSQPCYRAVLSKSCSEPMCADSMALTLHCLFPHRDVVVFNYRGYAPSTGTPSAKAVLSDSLMIFDRLQQAGVTQDIVVVGFSLGTAIAAYLARHRPVTGLNPGYALRLAGGLGAGALLVGSRRPAPPPPAAHARVRSWCARADGRDRGGPRQGRPGEAQRAAPTGGQQPGLCAHN